MKFVIRKQDVIDGLSKASGIISAKSGAAYLHSIWLQTSPNTLSVMATNSSIEFSGKYEAQVEVEGLVGVNGKQFIDLFRRLPDGDIQCSVDDEKKVLIVKHGRRTYRLPTNDSGWFQAFHVFPEQNSVTWTGDAFQELIERVFFCVDSENKEAISCMCLKKGTEPGTVEACGLNGYRFALKKIMDDNIYAMIPDDGLLLQKGYVSELRKWLGSSEIEVVLSDRRFFVRSGNGREMISLPRDLYQYPDCSVFLNRINDPAASVLRVNRQECIDALDRLLVFNTDKDAWARFKLSSSETILSTQSQGSGSASEFLEGTYNGSIEAISFNTLSMLEILSHFQSEQLELTLTTSEGPCAVRGSEDPDYLVLVMPMQFADATYYEEV